MYNFTSPDFWVVATAGLVIGAFLGWLITSLVQRRANAGTNVAQLRKEMGDYREEVNTHFAQTAELFRDTTEKYRDLYEHLAGGAQELCDDLPDRARVEFRPGHLLPATEASPEAEPADTVAASPESGNGAQAKPAAATAGLPESDAGQPRAVAS